MFKKTWIRGIPSYLQTRAVTDLFPEAVDLNLQPVLLLLRDAGLLRQRGDLVVGHLQQVGHVGVVGRGHLHTGRHALTVRRRRGRRAVQLHALTPERDVLLTTSCEGIGTTWVRLVMITYR